MACREASPSMMARDRAASYHQSDAKGKGKGDGAPKRPRQLHRQLGQALAVLCLIAANMLSDALHWLLFICQIIEFSCM